MRDDPEKHHRRSIRLQGYDYRTPGAYFVTIVTQVLLRQCYGQGLSEAEQREVYRAVVALVRNRLVKARSGG